MYPRRAIGADHDAGLADAVLDPLKWVRQRCTFKTVWVCQHITNCALGEVVIVKWQFDVGQKNTVALSHDYFRGDLLKHAAALGEELGLCGYECGPRLGGLRHKATLLLRIKGF